MTTEKSNKQNYTKEDTLPTSSETNETLNIVSEPITIENTPFHYVQFEDKYLLAFGKYALKEFNNLEDLLDKVNNKDWDLISYLITTIIDIKVN